MLHILELMASRACQLWCYSRTCNCMKHVCTIMPHALYIISFDILMQSASIRESVIKVLSTKWSYAVLSIIHILYHKT